MRNFDHISRKANSSPFFSHFDPSWEFQARMLEPFFIWILFDVAIPSSQNT